MRLLSCETPDDNNVVTFKDNIIHGAVVGMNFFIQDPTARGFQKKFSLAVISDDKNEQIIGSINTVGDDLMGNLNEITSFFECIVGVIKANYMKNDENVNEHPILHQCLKVKKEIIVEDLSVVSYPNIDYINLHKRLCHLLLQFLKAKVRLVMWNIQSI